MAQYVVLIYGDEQRWQSASEQERSEIGAGHQSFARRAGSAILASGELQPSSAAATLRVGEDGKPTITDGPFMEGKEVLGGFYVIEAANRDEAIALAGTLAEAQHDHSGVQVHPLVDHSGS
jgi:hypothetical protein